MKSFFQRMILLSCLLTASQGALAWPDKPIKLVVPYPPGAMGDTVSRLLADDLRTRLGQPVLVENRPGAGGNIGAAFVAQSAAEGHTFLIAATNNLVINQFLYQQMPFDPFKAFEPVTILVDVPTVLFINAGVPATSFKAFVDYAKANPGKVNYASPAAGTTVHLFTEMLNKRQGMGMTHIAYKGAAQALTALLANEVQLLAIGAGVGAPHVKSGKLRALAVSGGKRLAAFPDAQTFAEAGISEEASGNWWGVAAPTGTPKEVIQQFHLALRDALAEPKIRARLSELGAVPVGNSPAEMRRQLEQEAKVWAKVVRDVDAKLD
ncbi:MAG: tripartite tricarboxylate transporter substrate binding protein [Betaproteobacteria bacterium]